MTVQAEYTRTAIVLHWSVAAVIAFMLFTAYQAWASTSGQSELYWLQLHGSTGMLFAVLLAIRIVYHFCTAQPPALTTQDWERSLSFFVHKAMLVLIALQLVTGPVDIWSGGWPIDVFGWLQIPPPFAQWSDANHALIGNIHRFTGVSIFLLVVLHGAAALKHHLADRDATLKRMLGMEHE